MWPARPSGADGVAGVDLGEVGEIADQGGGGFEAPAGLLAVEPARLHIGDRAFLHFERPAELRNFSCSSGSSAAFRKSGSLVCTNHAASNSDDPTVISFAPNSSCSFVAKPCREMPKVSPPSAAGVTATADHVWRDLPEPVV
jgi:hypothetical protein